MTGPKDRSENRLSDSNKLENETWSTQHGLGKLTREDIRALNVHQNTPSSLPALTINKFSKHTAGNGLDRYSPVRTSEFASQASRLFPRIDTNANGELSNSELTAAVHDHSYRGRDAQVLSALYAERSALSNLEGNIADLMPVDLGIQRADLQRFDELTRRPVLRNGQYHDSVGDVTFQMQRTYHSQFIGGSNDELFSSRSGQAIHAVNPDAIDQGRVGDCYVMASISALAAADPERIIQMIKENDNGTFTVTFPGDPDNPVTVPRPTEAEMGLFQGHTHRGIWPNVLESAVGEYVRMRLPLISYANTRAEAIGGGGWPALAMHLLTGKPADTSLLPATRLDTTAQRLTQAFEQDRSVVVAAPGLPLPFIDARTPGGLPARHAYSVTEWNPQGPDGGTVTIRNPWGAEIGDKPRGITMSLRELQDNFAFIFIESRGS